jgi:glycosyltransferase involved in cell wall biosynthesis
MWHLIENFIRKEQRGKAPLKIAFVAPWFGEHIGGGAEAVCRDLAHSIQKLRPEVEVHVISTALKEFAADWNQNVHSEGAHQENGIKVWRFKAETHRDRSSFDQLNLQHLMKKGVDDLWQQGRPVSPLSPAQESFYIDHMINSRSMYRFLARNKAAYDFFLFLPYMFGTTYHGVMATGEKAVIIPCLHDERYAYMNIYQQMMKTVGAVLYNAKAEMRLAGRLYDLAGARQFYLGQMVDPNLPAADAERFRAKYQIKDPFVLYAGRKIVGKNVPLMVDFFGELKKNSPASANLKLVLIGKGDLNYPKEKYPDIIDLGFISAEDKADAYKAALALCQPSTNESFSIVMMEAWLQGTPCLVSSKCEVTRDHCKDSGGGFWFGDAQEFEQHVETLLKNQDIKVKMGQGGREYVLANFTPQIITERLIDYLMDLKKSRIPPSDHMFCG